MLTVEDIPASWRRVLELPPLEQLFAFVERERRDCEVFPPEDRVFAALAATPPERVRAVLLGQDPYHDRGQAQGLAFSVPRGCKLPPSLRNIFRELVDDLGGEMPESGDLSAWAEEGVLLLNPVLTVRAHAPGSHRGRGWEAFTDAVIRAVNAGPRPVVFLLWGAEAQKKQTLIDQRRHRMILGVHPSPLAAYRGFFGSRPFSRTNELLRELGRPPLTFALPGRDRRSAEELGLQFQ